MHGLSLLIWNLDYSVRKVRYVDFISLEMCGGGVKTFILIEKFNIVFK